MSLRRAALIGLVLSLWPAAGARAAEPVMALSDVRSGMRCTGLSVVRGTEPAAFDVVVDEVIAGDPSIDPRILVSMSGPAVDVTGIGPGFSGSPVSCPDAQGTMRVIGALSESVGEYGGKVALATPIESILAVSADPPAQPAAGAGTARASAARASRAARRQRALMRRARPLTLLTVTGLSAPLGRLAQAAARRAKRTLLAVPAGPLGAFPPQAMRPGAALGVGLSSGDIAVGAVGTVAYVDGDKVWGFGHSFEGVGRRALFLQDAYVFRVINNPNQVGELGGTYKLAAAGHAVGRITNDGFNAVAGHAGASPPSIPVKVLVTDSDTGVRRETQVAVADETDLGEPAGSSPLSFVGPLAVAQGGTGLLGAAPPKLTGRMCLRIVLREREDALRFCNRYVTVESDGGDFGFTNAVAGQAAADAAEALALIDAYNFGPLHVREVEANLTIERGAKLAYLRSVDLPSRVRRGQRVRARMVVQRPTGGRQTIPFTLRIPSGTPLGSRRLVFSGTGPDSGAGELVADLGDALDELLGDSSDAGPTSVAELADQVQALKRDDGVTLIVRTGEDEEDQESRAYLDPNLRIAGRATTRVRVTRR